MRKTEKRTPSDYPQFAFRISADEKKAVMKKVESVLEARLQLIGEDDFVPRKNDIIVEALLIGLETLEQRRTRKQRAP